MWNITSNEQITNDENETWTVHRLRCRALEIQYVDTINENLFNTFCFYWNLRSQRVMYRTFSRYDTVSHSETPRYNCDSGRERKEKDGESRMCANCVRIKHLTSFWSMSCSALWRGRGSFIPVHVSLFRLKHHTHTLFFVWEKKK